jgi:hypothetical protein
LKLLRPQAEWSVDCEIRCLQKCELAKSNRVSRVNIVTDLIILLDIVIIIKYYYFRLLLRFEDCFMEIGCLGKVVGLTACETCAKMIPAVVWMASSNRCHRFYWKLKSDSCKNNRKDWWEEALSSVTQGTELVGNVKRELWRSAKNCAGIMWKNSLLLPGVCSNFCLRICWTIWTLYSEVVYILNSYTMHKVVNQHANTMYVPFFQEK